MKKWFVIVFCVLSQSVIAQSIDLIDSLKLELALAQSDENKVNIMNELGNAYRWMDTDSAIYYNTQGVNLAETIQYKEGESVGLYQLAYVTSISGDGAIALKYAFRALEVAEILEDTSLQMMAHFNLLSIYNRIEDFQMALTHSFKTLKLSESLKSDLQPSQYYFPGIHHIIVGMIGRIYNNLGVLDSALYYSDLSAESSLSWSGLYVSYGDIYKNANDPIKALTYYKKGIPIAINSANHIDILSIYNSMSGIYESMNNLDSALFYAQKALQIELNNTYPLGRLESSIQLAKLYESLDLKDSVIKYQKQVIALKEMLSDKTKIRQAQSFAFNERYHRLELETQKKEDENTLRVTVLLGILIVISIATFLLYLVNRKKQKVNNLLVSQKAEIDLQRNKAEMALGDLQSTQTQLIHSEKMASLGELTAGIAHEIQNPLNFVNNFSEINKELVDELEEEVEKGDKEEAKAIIKDIRDNEEKVSHHGKRAEGIVKSMLQHSRTGSGEKELTDINALCDEYLRLAFHGFRAKDKSFSADFKADLDPDLPKVNVVPQDIGRVLLNLINNAFQAVKVVENPLVTVASKQDVKNVKITVSDNGAGIPDDIKDKIFQPFFTTKPTGEGTGLGLSMSYDIVTKGHGGTLSLSSNNGKGTEFSILLPT